VEYRALEEVCKFARGGAITKREAVPGKVPVVAGGQRPAYYHNRANRQGETIAISGSGAYAGFVSYWDAPVFLSDAFSVDPDPAALSTKYVYYFLTSIQHQIHDTKKGGGVPHVHGGGIGHFRVPLPPLPVQWEIARILDRFSEFTAEFAAELTAELTARKKQYEYYRDSLLTFGDDVPLVPLGEIATEMYCGAGIKRDEVAKDGEPCVRYGEIYTTYNIWFDVCASRTKAGSKTFGHGDILFAITGESVDEIAKS
jgi:type I restriction enzyme S subunit